MVDISYRVALTSSISLNFLHLHINNLIDKKNKTWVRPAGTSRAGREGREGSGRSQHNGDVAAAALQERQRYIEVSKLCNSNAQMHNGALDIRTPDNRTPYLRTILFENRFSMGLDLSI